MTGLQMLGALRALLQGCASWQACEAALFCLRCVHVQLRSRALGREGQAAHPEQQDSAAFLDSVFQVGRPCAVLVRGRGGGQQCRQTNAGWLGSGAGWRWLPAPHHGLANQGRQGRLLPRLALLQAMCSSGGQLAPWLASPWVCQTAAALIGDYAPWFGKRPQPQLEAALLLLLRALGHPQAGHQAASAFRRRAAARGPALRCSWMPGVPFAPPPARESPAAGPW
jgi:hypothetical protein